MMSMRHTLSIRMTGIFLLAMMLIFYTGPEAQSMESVEKAETVSNVLMATGVVIATVCIVYAIVSVVSKRKKEREAKQFLGSRHSYISICTSERKKP